MDIIAATLIALIVICISAYAYIYLSERSGRTGWSQTIRGEVELDDDIEEEHTEAPTRASEPNVGRMDRIKARRQKEKEERRQMQDAEREDRKKKREEDMVRRSASEQKEAERRRAEEAALQELRNAKVQRAENEYRQWVSHIEVEEKGEVLEESSDARLESLAERIRELKVVLLQDIAREFEMDIDTVVSSIESLVDHGTISGVFDERGKFIYVSDREFEAVAQFIKQRGRTSMQELVAECNVRISGR